MIYKKWSTETSSVRSKRTWPGYASFVWVTVFILFHIYWAFGGRFGLGGVSELLLFPRVFRMDLFLHCYHYVCCRHYRSPCNGSILGAVYSSPIYIYCMLDWMRGIDPAWRRRICRCFFSVNWPSAKWDHWIDL